MLNQYSPVPRARSSIAGKDATRQIYTGLGRLHSATEIENARMHNLLNQYSPVPRARSLIAGKDATRQRPVGARVARTQIYAG